MKARKSLSTKLCSALLGILCCFLLLAGCQEDEPDMNLPVLKDAVTYMLDEVSGSGIHGYVTFSRSEENESDVIVDVILAGTEEGKSYPAYVRFKSATESGDVAITLEPVTGNVVTYTNTRKSRTIISRTDEGSTFSIESLADLDAHVVVQKSESDPAIICKGDIGSNTLTNASKAYTLNTMGDSKITGTVTFKQRKNGFTQVTVQLDTTIENAEFPAHIYTNNATVGGDVAISLNPINGNTGKSVTSIRKTDGDNGTPITYDELLDFNGYISIHQSDVVMTTIAQTDIGSNELSGKSVTYDLDLEAENVMEGKATFAERKNGQTLVTITLEGTVLQGTYPAHIHAHTTAESGDIAISLNGVHASTDTSGVSVTNVAALDNGTAITYETLTNYNGYLNVQTEPGAVVAQGDIGENALTGESVEYPLDAIATGIQGKAVFYQRKNGQTLVTIELEGTAQGGMHPAHIHFNSAAEGGDIAISLNPVDGTSGISKTTVRQFDNGGPVSYEQLLNYDGYINVHNSEGDMATLLAQGDVGGNALTGNEEVYTLKAVGNSGVSGTAIVAERKSGAALVTLKLNGTTALGDHPTHIHFNSAEKGGEVAITLNNVNGVTGISKTHVEKLNNNLTISYEGLLDFNGYINVHKSPLDLVTIVAQGNIGANVE